MSIHRMSIDDFTSAVRLTVDNTLEHPEMLGAVQRYGYDQAALEAVRERLDRFKYSKSAQQDWRGRQRTATMRLYEDRDAFHYAVYGPHVEIARILFKNDTGIRTRLGLAGRRARDLDKWLGQARRFYDNALAEPEIRQRLAERGIDEPALTAGRQRVSEIGRKDSEQEDQKGRALQATRERDELRNELRGWLAEYRRIARIAFRQNPEWLIRVGIRLRRA